MKLTPHPAHSTKYSIAAFLCLATVALAGVLCLQAQNASPQPKPQQEYIWVETSGHPTVKGITLTNAADRDAAFIALVAAGYTHGLLMPKVAPTNDVLTKQLIETMMAATKAGILRPQTNNAPSPFE